MLSSTKKAIFVFLIVSALNAAGFADVRLRIPKGKASVTVNGKIASGGRICYFLNARDGQRLSAKVRSSGHVQILESGERTYVYDIEVGGDQSVCVDNIAGAAKYSLTVSIR